MMQKSNDHVNQEIRNKTNDLNKVQYLYNENDKIQ